MRTQSYIRTFDASEFVAVQGNVTTSRGRVSLTQVQPEVVIPGIGWQYPTTGVHFARTRKVFSPGCWTSWGFVDPLSSEPESYLGAVDTSLSFRAYRSGSSVYWDGASWSAAGEADWNSLTDFNANLGSLGGSVQLEVRLQTSNGNLTPSLVAVKLLWKGRPTVPLREWLYNGLVASFESSIRPITDFVAGSDGTASVDISTIDGSDGWSLQSVVEAYNYTSDPGRTTDILASFAGTTATLASPQPSGDKILLVCTYAPLVAVTTDSDFEELETTPAVFITAVIPETNVHRAVGATGPYAIDRTLPTPAGTVFRQPIPLQTFTVSYALTAPLALDLVSLSSAMIAWLQTHPTLRCSTYDEEVFIQAGPSVDWSTEAGELGALKQSSGTLRIVNIPWYGDSETGNSARDSAVTAGPIDAGDPNHPGEGYGVSEVTLRTHVAGGTGSDTTTIS